MKYAIHLDSFRAEPGDTECWQAIWSQGRACRKCRVDCYRKGWLAGDVTIDNRQRVQMKHGKTKEA